MQKYLLLFAVLMMQAGCLPCRNGSAEDQAQCLSALPKEDIQKNPQVAHFLSRNKVYVSLTTSPDRIGKVVLTLKSLNLDFVDTVFVSLPALYRDKDPYVIPEELKSFPKVQILQGGSDLGPITKLLPAVLEARRRGEFDAVVITVDDDIGYGADVMGQLAKHAILYNAAAGGKGMNIDFWTLDVNQWPERLARAPGCYSGHDVSYCDALEGYGSVAYPVRHIDVELLTALTRTSKACKTADDVVISYGLAKRGVPRVLVGTVPFFSSSVPYEHGFGEDALHRGSGFLSTAANVDTNAMRYQKCLASMHEAKL